MCPSCCHCSIVRADTLSRAISSFLVSISSPFDSVLARDLLELSVGSWSLDVSLSETPRSALCIPHFVVSVFMFAFVSESRRLMRQASHC